MTIFRAIIRRHLASGLDYQELDHSIGFELEWFITSLLDENGITWIPGDTTKRSNEEQIPHNRHNNDQSQEESPQFTWLVRTGNETDHRRLTTSNEEERPVLRGLKDVSNLSIPQSILNLRRHLGDLGRWQGPASNEGLALAKAIEKVMEFFLPFTKHADTRKSGPETAGVCEMERGGDATIGMNETQKLDWYMAVDCSPTSQIATHSETLPSRNVKITLTRTSGGAWMVPIDEIDAALSLSLYTVKEKRREDRQGKDDGFPSRNDEWIRGASISQRCFQVLGPSSPVLLRDLSGGCLTASMEC
ncbi:hypothetical protein NW752_012473 [Fusarium irregulare]|nr:hypothetical protein NW752_012473 [Fusarium irregulare]